MTGLDGSSGTENARPPDAQGSPLGGVISSRTRLGIGSGDGAGFVEQVGQSHEVCSDGWRFGHDSTLDRLADKGKREACTSPRRSGLFSTPAGRRGGCHHQSNTPPVRLSHNRIQKIFSDEFLQNVSSGGVKIGKYGALDE